jgi:hypothetical protein
VFVLPDEPGNSTNLTLSLSVLILKLCNLNVWLLCEKLDCKFMISLLDAALPTKGLSLQLLPSAPRTIVFTLDTLNCGVSCAHINLARLNNLLQDLRVLLHYLKALVLQLLHQ